jgi:hypothetical protein
MRYLLNNRKFDIMEANAKVSAVSRSIHYGLFLVFEGIRFFCKQKDEGKLEVVFLNWDKNLTRFKNGIAFNLGSYQQHLVPSVDELEELFIQKYFKHPSMRDFFMEMAKTKTQGYLRPYTVDEKQSIGVTFPEDPSIRAVVCCYDRYLGEPFSGVVVPNLVRVMGINRTGCLKLGVNYLMSIKAVDAARKIHPEEGSRKTGRSSHYRMGFLLLSVCIPRWHGGENTRKPSDPTISDDHRRCCHFKKNGNSCLGEGYFLRRANRKGPQSQTGCRV